MHDRDRPGDRDEAIPSRRADREDGEVTRRVLVLFCLMSVIWGIPYLFIRIAVAEVTPATLVFWRTGIAAVILVPLALLRTDLRPVLARWRWVVAFAAVEIAIPWVLLGSAEQVVSSSLAALLVAGVPLVGAVIAVLTGGERLGRTGLLGLLIGLLGVGAIVGGDLQASNIVALVEMGFVVLGYAIGPAILSRRLGGLPSVAVMALSLGLTALLYAPVAIVQRPPAVPSTEALAAILILGIVCTALAFVLFSALIGAIGPVRATVITYVNPAVAAVLGVVVLGESFTPAMAAGFGLVILGSALATRPARGGRVEAPAVSPESARGWADAGADEPAT
jgi:drug/metabolite transporter (DMT)-like permease